VSTTALRADAQRNLERVLDAAAELFAERGCDVSVDEIANRAGVGHATVFRRFPTKDALIAAVVSRQIRQLGAYVEQLTAEREPGEAFEAFIWHVAELHAHDRGMHEGYARCGELRDVAEAKAEMSHLFDGLILRAQEAGALRRDVSVDDVSTLLGSTILGARDVSEPDRWRRYVEVLLAGLRPPSA
jgi:AcrR family transcriptional regulator